MPFRSFAFITFEDPAVASSLLGKPMTINDERVIISSAVPKMSSKHIVREFDVNSEMNSYLRKYLSFTIASKILTVKHLWFSDQKCIFPYYGFERTITSYVPSRI